MRKIIYFTCALLASSLVWGAQVTVDSIDSMGNPSTYSSQGQYTFGAQPYEVFVNQSLASPQGNSGEEELLFLGAHESVGNNGGNTTIQVNIDNASGQTTKGVSLVLSAAENTIWNFDIAQGVQLNNIFVIAQKQQILKFGNQEISLALGATDTQGLIQLSRSVQSICGYELIEELQSCNTDKILGFNSTYEDPLTFTEEETNAANDNYLAALTDLEVTGFSGSYFVESFDITIDSVAIPLPPTVYLFGAALAILCIPRRRFGNRSATS